MPLRAALSPTPVARASSPQLKRDPPAAPSPSPPWPLSPVAREALALRELLLRRRVRLRRFSLSRLRAVVVPPVEIPHPLDVPGGVAYLVSGAKIPMTRDMARRHRKKLLQRLPDAIDERAAVKFF